MISAGLAWLKGSAALNGYWYSSEMARCVQQTVASFDPHVLMAYVSPMSTYFLRLMNSGELRQRVFMVDFIDSLGRNAAARASRTSRPLNWIWKLESRRFFSFEQRLAEQADLITIISESDRVAAGLEDRGEVVPNGVDTEELSFQLEGRKSNTLLYFGHMGYFANVDAAEFLVNSILPFIQERVPDVQLHIVGTSPSSRVHELSRQNVTVTGFVPTLLPYLHQSTVALLPIRTGSGQQNKILEAFAAGLPVVTTPFVLNGVRAVPNRDLLVGSSAQSIAASTVRLLTKKKERQQIAVNARKLAESKYTWGAVTDKLDLALRRCYAAKLARPHRIQQEALKRTSSLAK